MRVRGYSDDAADIGDRLFLETLVRIHRMAEGVGFTGIVGKVLLAFPGIPSNR